MKQLDIEPNEEKKLLAAIKSGNQQAFEILFKTHYTSLVRFGLRFVRQPQIIEELVHDALLQFWNKREEIHISSSVQSYLFTAVKNRCLNYLKSKYVQWEVSNTTEEFQHPSVSETEEKLAYDELSDLLNAAIEQLPQKCRAIFQLRNSTEMTYEEIGTALGLSKKTVAAQMSIALKRLKTFLDNHWEVICLLFCLTF